jgi:pancreatic triacylglycerol lipase
MINVLGASPADFHIIAHSLGAAVAGYAGHRINELGRITGRFFSCLFIEFV